MTIEPERCGRPIFCRVVATLCVAWIAGQPAVARDSQESESSAAAAEGKLLAEQGNYKAAIEQYQLANDLLGGESVACLLSLAVLHNSAGDYRKAGDFARKALAVTDKPELLRRAYRELGVALHSRLQGAAEPWIGKRNIRKHLKEAEQAFRKVIELGEGDGDAYYLLANVLAEQMIRTEKWELHEEIKTLAGEYLRVNRDGPRSDWARGVRCGVDELSADVSSAAESSLSAVSRRLAGEVFATEAVLRGEVTKPEKVSAPAPMLPYLARKARMQGTVIVQVIIDKLGDIAAVELLQGLPLCLSEEAIKAIKNWKFKPATLDGEPVNAFYNLTVTFRFE